MENKKIIASFELTLMIVYLFAFSYGISMTDGSFKQIENKYAEMQSKSQIVSKSNGGGIVRLFAVIFNKMKQPMIPIVGADGVGAGCCSITNDGEKCATTAKSSCSGSFAEGSLCKDTSYCRKGCCFDKDTGVYDENVLKSDCPTSWTDDPNCNMPDAALGCCSVGDMNFFNTAGQCRVRTKTFAQNNDSIVNWTTGLSEVQCLILSEANDSGACVLSGGDCKFATKSECDDLAGQFNDGYLCTASSLNTTCKMTDKTTCVDGKDGVYFVDSCGNDANIYNSKLAKNQSYWNKIILPENSCGSKLPDANANSPSCGNCNRFIGSICSSAIKDKFKVKMGNSYCKDTSCLVDGTRYKNGESWCVYDGAIGNGDRSEEHTSELQSH